MPNHEDDTILPPERPAMTSHDLSLDYDPIKLIRGSHPALIKTSLSKACKHPSCSQTFTPLVAGPHVKEYCSDRCRKAYYNTWVRERFRRNREALNKAILAGIMNLQSEGELRSITFEVEEGLIK